VLEEAVCTRAWGEGWAMPLEEAIGVALEETPRASRHRDSRARRLLDWIRN
jgi:hypothetical protein